MHSNGPLPQVNILNLAPSEENPMVPFVTGRKSGKANSAGGFCICGFVTCYISHYYKLNADFYSPPNSISDSTKIIFLQAKLIEQ